MKCLPTRSIPSVEPTRYSSRTQTATAGQKSAGRPNARATSPTALTANRSACGGVVCSPSSSRKTKSVQKTPKLSSVWRPDLQHLEPPRLDRKGRNDVAAFSISKSKNCNSISILNQFKVRILVTELEIDKINKSVTIELRLFIIGRTSCSPSLEKLHFELKI